MCIQQAVNRAIITAATGLRNGPRMSVHPEVDTGLEPWAHSALLGAVGRPWGSPNSSPDQLGSCGLVSPCAGALCSYF